MTHLKNLLAVRAKLADPKHFTAGCVARNAEGLPTDLGRYDAVSWCLIGAAYAVGVRDVDAFAAALVRHMDPTHLISDGADPSRTCMSYSDRRGHAGVLALLDRAIEAERKASRQRQIDQLLEPALCGATGSGAGPEKVTESVA